MSPRLPRVTAADLLRALNRDGWFRHHQKGSHIYFKHPTKKGYVTVAMHTGKTIPPDTLQRILQQAGLSADELRVLL